MLPTIKSSTLQEERKVKTFFIPLMDEKKAMVSYLQNYISNELIYKFDYADYLLHIVIALIDTDNDDFSYCQNMLGGIIKDHAFRCYIEDTMLRLVSDKLISVQEEIRMFSQSASLTGIYLNVFPVVHDLRIDLLL